MGAVQDHRRRFLDLFQPPGGRAFTPLAMAPSSIRNVWFCVRSVNRSRGQHYIRRLVCSAHARFEFVKGSQWRERATDHR